MERTLFYPSPLWGEGEGKVETEVLVVFFYAPEPGWPLARRASAAGGEVYGIAACAGMTPRGPPKGAWIPAFAGMTRRGWRASAVKGRGVRDSRLRGNDTKRPTQRSLDSCFRRNDTAGLAGLCRKGERRSASFG